MHYVSSYPSLQVHHFRENLAKVSGHLREYSRFRETLRRDFSGIDCKVDAAVVPSPNQTIDVERLREFLEHNVRKPPARPWRIVQLDALPVTALGKIFKPALRDLAVREKVRAEIEWIFGLGTQADIEVDRDDKLNTLVRV